MYLIETCPNCGSDLHSTILTSIPPIEVKECYSCGWRCENASDKVVRIPYQDTPEDNLFWMHDSRGVLRCPKCGNYLELSGLNGGRGDANYCPNCGVKLFMMEDRSID